MAIIAAALIIALSTVASAVVLANVLAAQRRTERREDNARLDAVAMQAAEAARILIESNRITATSLEGADAVVSMKLDVIHKLVNSSMTASKQSEYDAIHRELALMREVVALHQAQGRDPSADTTAAIRVTDEKLLRLGAELEMRNAQDAIAAELAATLAAAHPAA